MRICHIITRLILGGAQENTILTCEGQHAMGHEVTLITGPAIGPEGELMSRAMAGGYKIIVLDQMRREIHPFRDIKTYRKLARLLGELSPDVVHTHSSKAGILGRWAAARANVPRIVHTIHGLAFHRYEKWWKNRLYIAAEKSAAKITDAIICVADAMTRQALEAGVGRCEQYATVHSGMEVDTFFKPCAEAKAFRDSLHLPAGAVLVTQVSRIAELKGHEYIISAAKEITDPNVYFCFVGDGHLMGQVKRHIREAGLGERFRLTGLLHPSGIPAVMQATDILIHCSLREGLARTLPQAMLAGKAVISFDVDGAREVVNKDTGFLLQPADVKGIIESIKVLSADAALRNRLGDNGRELCCELFSHHRMVEKIQKVYDSIKNE